MRESLDFYCFSELMNQQQQKPAIMADQDDEFKDEEEDVFIEYEDEDDEPVPVFQKGTSGAKTIFVRFFVPDKFRILSSSTLGLCYSSYIGDSGIGRACLSSFEP